MQRLSVRGWIAVGGLLAAVLLGCGNSPQAAGTATTAPAAATTNTVSATAAAALDARGVLELFVGALNRGDRAAAEAMLRPDATWERGGQCPPGQCAGVARLAQEIERDIANHHRLRVASMEGTGESVVAKIELQTDQASAAGVERIVQVFRMRTNEGKIASVVIENDLSDPVTAAFIGGRRGQ